jgi:hypothetical protein
MAVGRQNRLSQWQHSRGIVHGTEGFLSIENKKISYDGEQGQAKI